MEILISKNYSSLENLCLRIVLGGTVLLNTFMLLFSGNRKAPKIGEATLCDKKETVKLPRLFLVTFGKLGTRLS